MPELNHSKHKGLTFSEDGSDLVGDVTGYVETFTVENSGEATDHAAAIEQAYADAVTAGGGIVRFPKGRFGVSSIDIDWTPDVHVQFLGHGAMDSTLVKLGADSDPVLKVHTDTVPPNIYTTWGDFGIEGNDACPGMVITRINRWGLRDVKIGQCTDAFVSDGSLAFYLLNVVVGDSERGYVFRKATVSGGDVYSNAIYLQRCHAVVNSVVGMDFEGGAGVHVGQGCVLEENGTSGDNDTGAVRIKGTFADEFGLGNVTLEGVHFELNHGWCVQVDGGSDTGSNTAIQPYLVMRDVQINSQETIASYTDHAGTTHTDVRLGVRVGALTRGVSMDGVISNGPTLLEVEDTENTSLNLELIRFASFAPSDLAAAAGDVDETELEVNLIKSHLDTQAKIQARLDALGSTGGEIILPPTTIEVSEAGTKTGDVLSTPYCFLIDQSYGPLTIRGTQGVTTLFLADNQNPEVIPILARGDEGDHRTDPTLIQDLVIDGNAANQPTWPDFGVLEVVYADYFTALRVELVNAPKFGCQTFRKSMYYTFDACILRDAEEGIRTESKYGIVRNCRFIFENPTGALLSLATNADVTTESEGVLVHGNQFVGGATQCSLTGAKRCIVRGNTFYDQLDLNQKAIGVGHYSGAGGFNADHNVIANNVLYNIRNGVQLQGDLSGNGVATYRTLIVGNEIIEGPDINLSNGIQETADGPNYNVAHHNLIHGATTPLTESGADSDIQAANNTIVS